MQKESSQSIAWNTAADRIALDTWYRMKIRSPSARMQQLRLELLNADQAQLSMLDSAIPSGQYGLYIYLPRTVASIRIKIRVTAPDSELAVGLRPISVIEYLWKSFRAGRIARWASSLRYFLTPGNDVVMLFHFPRPPRGPDEVYRAWIEQRENVVVRDHVCTVSVSETPPISILLPVCDPSPSYLRQAIESVRRQSSPKWQLCIVDDASAHPAIRKIVSAAAQDDDRIGVQFREQRSGLSAATNAAFAGAASPFVACLDQNDLLAPSAIEACAVELARHPHARLLYTDEDKIDSKGIRSEPYFKPDFSLEGNVPINVEIGEAALLALSR